MYFILGVVFLLSTITALIIYKVLIDSLIPQFLRSKHAAKFRARLSRVIFRLIMDVKDDLVCRLETICEPDGDEPFEPYLDSPLHRCPPTEYVLSPPKEVIEAVTDNNNNVVDANNNLPRRRGPRRRIMIRPPPPAVEVVPPPNPAVQVERIPPRQNRQIPPNLFAVARQMMEGENRNRVGPRRVLELRGLAGLLSPPPHQNNNNNNNPVFQFD